VVEKSVRDSMAVVNAGALLEVDHPEFSDPCRDVPRPRFGVGMPIQQ